MNAMRQQYRALSETEMANIQTVKTHGQTLFEFVDGLGNSRELSLAKTKVEEAVMWAVKAITG